MPKLLPLKSRDKRQLHLSHIFNNKKSRIQTKRHCIEIFIVRNQVKNKIKNSPRKIKICFLFINITPPRQLECKKTGGAIIMQVSRSRRSAHFPSRSLLRDRRLFASRFHLLRATTYDFSAVGIFSQSGTGNSPDALLNRHKF